MAGAINVATGGFRLSLYILSGAPAACCKRMTADTVDTSELIAFCA